MVSPTWSCSFMVLWSDDLMVSPLWSHGLVVLGWVLGYFPFVDYFTSMIINLYLYFETFKVKAMNNI